MGNEWWERGELDGRWEVRVERGERCEVGDERT